MYCILYQHRVELHTQQLLQEAEIEQMFALIVADRQQRQLQSSSPRSIHNWTRELFRRQTRLQETQHTTTSIAESEGAIRTTFMHMHARGLVSDYDEQFIGCFIQTFQQELLRQRAAT